MFHLTESNKPKLQGYRVKEWISKRGQAGCLWQLIFKNEPTFPLVSSFPFHAERIMYYIFLLHVTLPDCTFFLLFPQGLWKELIPCSPLQAFSYLSLSSSGCICGGIYPARNKSVQLIYLPLCNSEVKIKDQGWKLDNFQLFLFLFPSFTFLYFNPWVHKFFFFYCLSVLSRLTALNRSTCSLSFHPILISGTFLSSISHLSLESSLCSFWSIQSSHPPLFLKSLYISSSPPPPKNCPAITPPHCLHLCVYHHIFPVSPFLLPFSSRWRFIFVSKWNEIGVQWS